MLSGTDVILPITYWQVEIKNLNSFSSVSRAIDYEISRQVLLHSQGEDKEIVQETRLWEEGAQVIGPLSSLLCKMFLCVQLSASVNFIVLFRKRLQ